MIEKVVLASASPRRKEILEMLGIPFEVVVSDAEEKAETEMPAGEYVSYLAREKCRNAVEKLESRGEKVIISSRALGYKIDGRFLGRGE